jgi:hypothetical protein
LKPYLFFFVNKERCGRREEDQEDHGWYAARSSDEQGEPSTWKETDIQSINSLGKHMDNIILASPEEKK